MVRLRRSHQFSLISASLLAGIAIERLAFDDITLAVLLLAVGALPLFGLRLGLLALLAFGLGTWRADQADFSRTLLAHKLGQTVQLAGVISDDPAIDDRNQTSFTLSQVVLDRRVAGRPVRIYTGYKTLRRGERVAASGKLKPAKGSVPVQISYASVAVTSDKISWLEHWRQHLLAATRSALPDPLGGFGLGLLIGARAMIDKSLQTTLNAVGLSHLIAVSGYNLTIIIQASRSLFGRISHFVSTAASCWLIAVFLLLTGFSASIVRAALVSALALLITYYGYRPDPLTLIAVPAALTAVVKPDYLMLDLGWQLSFLAFAGILILAPLVQSRWIRHPNTIKLLVLECLAAQVMTMPLIVGVFGSFSVVAPLANAVILPMVPLAMLLSFLSGALRMLWPLVPSWPAEGVLSLMVGLIQWFGSWNGANRQIGLSRETIFGCYALIAILAMALVRKKPIVQAKSKHYHFD